VLEHSKADLVFVKYLKGYCIENLTLHLQALKDKSTNKSM
jgi:hypothetical protein